MVLIPFTSTKETFICQCGDFQFQFDTLYNDYEGIWHFDLTDAQTGIVLCTQVSILLGLDLLRPMNLGIGSLFAADMTGADLEAGPDDLGTRVIVAYYTPAEMEALALALLLV